MENIYTDHLGEMPTLLLLAIALASRPTSAWQATAPPRLARPQAAPWPRARFGLPVCTETNAQSSDTPSDTPLQRLRLFGRLAAPYFKRAEGAKLDSILMLALVLVKSGIAVIFSYVSRDFFSALSARDQALFLEKAAYYAVALAVATPLTALYAYQRERLALSWREWMTTELARQYCSGQAYCTCLGITRNGCAACRHAAVRGALG